MATPYILTEGLPLSWEKPFAPSDQEPSDQATDWCSHGGMLSTPAGHVGGNDYPFMISKLRTVHPTTSAVHLKRSASLICCQRVEEHLAILLATRMQPQATANLEKHPGWRRLLAQEILCEGEDRLPVNHLHWPLHLVSSDQGLEDVRAIRLMEPRDRMIWLHQDLASPTPLDAGSASVGSSLAIDHHLDFRWQEIDQASQNILKLDLSFSSFSWILRKTLQGKGASGRWSMHPS